MRYRYAPFLVIGIAFIAIGASGQRPLLYVGIAFLLLAALLFPRRRR